MLSKDGLNVSKEWSGPKGRPSHRYCAASGSAVNMMDSLMLFASSTYGETSSLPITFVNKPEISGMDGNTLLVWSNYQIPSVFGRCFQVEEFLRRGLLMSVAGIV